MNPRRWLAEPLVHFLLAGLALFAAVSWWQGPLDAGRTIRLSREDLIVFLQGRAPGASAKNTWVKLASGGRR